MFGSLKEFKIKILSDGGEKSCVVRFPTNAELCDRARKQRAIRRNLGRGKSQYDPGNTGTVDAELFEKIRLDRDGQSFDEAEAAKVIGRIEDVRVLDVERAGEAYRVELAVPGARVIHTLRIPAQKDVVQYGRSSVRTIDSGRQAEIRMTLEPSLALWNKVRSEVTGYAPDTEIPVNHMDAALVAMLNQMEADIEEADPEE